MKASYDLEDLIADTAAFIKPRLNAAIAELEAQKIAAGRVASEIQPIPDNAYYLYTWNDESLNEEIAIFITGTATASDGEGPFTVQTFEIDISVVLSGMQNDSLANQKLLRYTKALKNIFEADWGKIKAGIVREKIETTSPTDFKVVARSNAPIKAAGVLLTAKIA